MKKYIIILLFTLCILPSALNAQIKISDLAFITQSDSDDVFIINQKSGSLYHTRAIKVGNLFNNINLSLDTLQIILDSLAVIDDSLITIRTSILALYDTLDLKVSQTVYDTLAGDVQNNTTNIALNAYQISLRATYSAVHDSITAFGNIIIPVLNLHTSEIDINTDSIAAHTARLTGLITDLNLAESQILVTADSIDLFSGYFNSADALVSRINLKPGSIKLSSNKIEFSGAALFKALNGTNDSTTINGDKITTGTVKADSIRASKYLITPKIYMDENNYWYADGRFKVYTDASNFINKTASSLLINASSFSLSSGNLLITSSGYLWAKNGATTYWRLNADGSGSLAQNNINWDASGNVSVTGDIDMGVGSTLSADYINSGTLNADRIAAGSISVNKLIAGTLTGYTVQTAVSGQRIILDNSNTIKFYNSSGDLSATLYGSGDQLYSSGNIASGAALIGSGLSIDGGHLLYVSSQLSYWGSEVASHSWVESQGYLTSEVDGSTSNELQTLSYNAGTQSLSISSGNSVTISGFLTSEVDGSTTNEIQTLGTSGNTITLTSGGSVTAPYATTAGSVTNGVYTNGSYTNPSWIASLQADKVYVPSGYSTVATWTAGGLLSNSSISLTTLGYLDATSSIQTQLNGKQAADADLDDLADGHLAVSKISTDALTNGVLTTSYGVIGSTAGWTGTFDGADGYTYTVTGGIIKGRN